MLAEQTLIASLPEGMKAMRILFINMPFAGLRPAIGVSLLSAQLGRAGIPAEVLYMNLRFVDLVGLNDYAFVAEMVPAEALGGDWVFARAAFGPRPEADDHYLATYRQRFGDVGDCDGSASLLRCREVADAFIDECVATVDWASYDVVGFTSSFTQHVAALAVAKRIKAKFPALTTVFGGANCEDEMGLELHRLFPFIDYVCSGEADDTFPQLINDLAAGGNGAGIPGLIWRDNGQSCFASLTPSLTRDLDALPHPDYDDYFAQLADCQAMSDHPRFVLMETSRGCWWGQKHQCTFCGLNGNSMNYRAKSGGRALDELTALTGRYGVQIVEMVDNILNMRYFHDLIPRLRDLHLDLDIFYEIKANLTRQQVQDLYDVGVRTVQPGIESLSSDVLRLMQKGATAMVNLQLLKWCKEIGVKPMYGLIYGFPHEDPQSYTATVDLIQNISHLQPPVSISRIRLDRFSPNYFRATELGIANVRPDRSYADIYPFEIDSLAKLAYYFEFDYVDGRDPDSYMDATRAAVDHWKSASENRSMTFTDCDGLLEISDSRSVAVRQLSIIERADRELYLYCHASRSDNDLLAKFGPDVRTTLERLVSDRLMIELDGRYLSLAVRVQAPNTTVPEALADVAMAPGEPIAGC